MPRKNKYRVSPAAERRWNGRLYGSKAEMKYAQELYWRKHNGECDVIEFVEQPKTWLGVPENVYIPDFLVIPSAGAPYYVDVKGIETAKFKRDKKLWKEYGWLDLHLVKLSGKKFKTTEVISGGKKPGLSDS